MRITVDLKGHFDWVPVPDDVKVTEADHKALRVKEMVDGTLHAKIEADRETHFECGIHEESICRQVAAKAKIGDDTSRSEIVATELAGIIKHHFARKHMLAVHVHDDGPDEALMTATLAALEVTGDHAAQVLEAYLADKDVGAHLAATHKVKHHKHAPAVSGGKHAPTTATE
jgi:hypothetical protein